MLALAREFRKVPTKGEKILWEALRGRKSEVIEKNLAIALDLVRDAIRTINQNKMRDIPSPFMGEVKGGG
jgi:hypothetical protein